MTRHARVVDLDEIHDRSFGGKAFGLAELARHGFRIPGTFVLADARVGDSPAEMLRRYSRLGSSGGAPAVAVRSSAVGEDGEHNSFAGQYETVLGVVGPDALQAAVDRCLSSALSARAVAYANSRGVAGLDVTMHLVVQEMVDARSAGVVFSADPASGRRDLCVVDAVTGLGEALVDGSTASDHFVVDGEGRVVDRPPAERTALTPDEAVLIAREARRAAEKVGQPVDLEWAIDADGALHWLQLRPVTALPGDLNEADTLPTGPHDVYTRCNVGEMMPGAFPVLTASVSLRAIDYALQETQRVGGGTRRVEDRWIHCGYFSGHMFLNLTSAADLSTGVLGNSWEQYSQSLCGRVVDEVRPGPPKTVLARLRNTLALAAHALTAGAAVRRLDRDLASFAAPSATEAPALLAELEAGIAFYREATVTHVRSSSRSAVATNVFEGVLIRLVLRAGGTESDARAASARLLAGANNAEGARMVADLAGVVDSVRADDVLGPAFAAAAPDEAVALLKEQRGTASRRFEAFLVRHGHRGDRELCMRQPSWADDPQGLGVIMQGMLRADPLDRVRDGSAATEVPGSDHIAIRLLARMAQAGAEGREATKSRMVLVAHRLKRGFRLLGEVLAEAGALPDPDLVFFLDRTELARLVRGQDVRELGERAQRRRDALPFQQRLEFPDVSIGLPRPRYQGQQDDEGDADVITGRPVCHGVAEGVVRVARSVEEARHLLPGEILVAPVTDVAWSPYFTLVSALVTDIGSAVSHGAVVAREFGLPCVVNTGRATRALRTGDRVRVDGQRGIVQIVHRATDPPPETLPAPSPEEVESA